MPRRKQLPPPADSELFTIYTDCGPGKVIGFRIPFADRDTTPFAIAALVESGMRIAEERYQTGSRKKHEIVAERNKVIDGLLLVGFNLKDPDKIHKHLQENYPHLIRKGKGYVAASSVMKAYHRSR